MLFKVWMINLFNNTQKKHHPHRPYLFLVFGENKTTHTGQAKRISKYLLLYGEKWQTKHDIEQMPREHWIYFQCIIFLLTAFSVLLPKKRNVQQVHNRVTEQVIPSLQVTEGAKSQHLDFGSSIISKHGEIPIPREKVGSLLSCLAFFRWVIPTLRLQQIITG